LRKYCESTILITLDKDGVIVLPKNENHPFIIETKLNHDAKDTTAAADIFRASFLHYNLQSSDLKNSVELASKIASWSVGIEGVDNTLEQISLNFN